MIRGQLGAPLMLHHLDHSVSFLFITLQIPQWFDMLPYITLGSRCLEVWVAKRERCIWFNAWRPPLLRWIMFFPFQSLDPPQL